MLKPGLRFYVLTNQPRVPDSISSVVLKYLTMKKHVQYTWCTAPPSSSAENGNWLAEMVNSCPTNTLMIGDFNLPGINWKNLTSDTGKGAQFLDACTERGLNQLVHFPTHNKGNILDLVLSDTPDSVHSVASHGRLGRSDHDMIVVRINVGKRQKKLPELTKNWRKADWEKMKYEMGQRDWQGEGQRRHGSCSKPQCTAWWRSMCPHE